MAAFFWSGLVHSRYSIGMPKPAQIGAVFCAAIVALTLLACRKQQRLVLTATPNNALGQYYKLTVEKVEQCKPLSDPKPGNIMLGIEMTFEGTTDVKVWASSLDRKLTDAHGNSYEQTTSGCLRDGLRWGQYELRTPLYFEQPVDKHEKHRGWISYQVPANVRELTFTCRPFREATSSNSPWIERQHDREARFALKQP